jgi:hypothetical protein
MIMAVSSHLSLFFAFGDSPPAAMIMAVLGYRRLRPTAIPDQVASTAQTL